MILKMTLPDPSMEEDIHRWYVDKHIPLLAKILDSGSLRALRSLESPSVGWPPTSMRGRMGSEVLNITMPGPLFGVRRLCRKSQTLCAGIIPSTRCGHLNHIEMCGSPTIRTQQYIDLRLCTIVE